MLRRPILLSLLVLCPVLALAQGGPPPARVQLDAVRQESVEQWREVTGSLRASRRSSLAAEIEGRVVELPVREGDRVVQGDTVVRIDDEVQRLAVASARADLAARRAAVLDAEAGLEQARRDLPRAQKLFDSSQAISEKFLDDAKTDLARARAFLARARAERQAAASDLALAEEQLADTVVVAPFDGAITRRYSEVGSWLRRGDAIVELTSLDELEGWLDVPERFFSQLSPGPGSLQLRVGALKRVIEAPLIMLVPDADPLARTLRLRVAVPGGMGLMPGMSVVGLVPTGQSGESLTVDRDAILRDDAGEFVYFDGGGRAVVARVVSLFAVGDRVALRSESLKPGMNVVTEGHQRLFPGQPLQPMNGAGD